MKFIFSKEYQEYLRDNPEGYWFKRKLYGWGWFPVKWQGWAVIGLFIIAMGFIASGLGSEPTNADLAWYFAKLAVAVTVLIFICYKTGEKPRWQWGSKK